MPKDFEFDLNAPRWRFAKRDVVAELQRVAQRSSEPLNGARYKASKPQISLDTVLRMFGSFAAACQEAGLPTNGIKNELSDADLIDHFENLVRLRGGKPSSEDFKKYRLKNGSGIHYSTFTRRLGNFKTFLKNYNEYYNDRISLAELIDKSRPKPRVGISKALKAELFRKFESTCQMCGAKAPSVRLHIDHIKPRSKGGADDISNYTVKCEGCNLGKGARFEG